MDPVFETICKPMMPPSPEALSDKQKLMALSQRIWAMSESYETVEARTLICKVSELLADTALEL